MLMFVELLIRIALSLTVHISTPITIDAAPTPDRVEFEEVTFENCSFKGNGICGPLVQVDGVLVDANGWVFTYSDDMFPLVTGCVDAAPCESMQCSTDYICESREGKKDA